MGEASTCRPRHKVGEHLLRILVRSELGSYGLCFIKELVNGHVSLGLILFLRLSYARLIVHGRGGVIYLNGDVRCVGIVLPCLGLTHDGLVVCPLVSAIHTRALRLAAILVGWLRVSLFMMKRRGIGIFRETEKRFSKDFAISVPLMYKMHTLKSNYICLFDLVRNTQ